MGYAVRNQEKFLMKNKGRVVEKKVHNQIHKLRVEDSMLGVAIIKEVLVNGKYGIVGGDEVHLPRKRVAPVVMFSRPAVLPASPLGGKTPLKSAY